MNFIRRIGRDEIYIKYVHQLVNVRFYMQTESQLGLMTRFVDASSVAELC
jgi:dedicator of cytokinesis protein 3